MQKVTVTVRTTISTIFPDNWNDNEMEQYIKDNYQDYDVEVEDVEIDDIDLIEEEQDQYDEWIEWRDRDE